MIFTTAFIVSALLALEASATPIRAAGPQEGSKSKKEAVKKATRHAHDAVLHMEANHGAARKGDKSALGHIHHAFGNSANLDHIGSHTQKLKDGKYGVYHADDPNHHGAGYYDPKSGHVSFGTAFHGGTDKQRAGHVLHESSHKILGTKDVFDKHGNPISAQRADHKKGEHSGYADSGLHNIKNGVAKGNMHHNADSWRAYGSRVAPHLVQRNELERDMFKREILLELMARFDMEAFDNMD